VAKAGIGIGIYQVGTIEVDDNQIRGEGAPLN
jgi:hypothetical protein